LGNAIPIGSKKEDSGTTNLCFFQSTQGKSSKEHSKINPPSRQFIVGKMKPSALIAK
jgi:hypothetical protein